MSISASCQALEQLERFMADKGNIGAKFRGKYLIYTTSGSTAGLAEGIGQARPWMTKAVRGAALTRYGR